MNRFFELRQAIPLIDLEQTSAKIAQGSLLCMAEGVLSLLLLSAPANAYFFVAGFTGAMLLLLATLRFRTSKLGTDISELGLYEVLLWALALTLYLNQVDPTPCRAVIFAIAPLKLLRIFGAGFLKNDGGKIGWAIFGVLTYGFFKKQLDQKVSLRDYYFLPSAIIVSGAGGYYLPGMPTEIVIATWFAIPLGYVAIKGPILINAIKTLVMDFMTSTRNDEVKANEINRLKQELAAQQNENAELKKENDALRQLHALPKKAHTDLIQAYESTKPARQGHLVKIAQNIAAVFSSKRDS